MVTLLWIALFGSVAQASDVEMTYQARALDAQGAGANGSLTVTVTLHTALTGSSSVWTDTFTGTPVNDGYFTVVLGSGLALDSGTLDQTLFAEVSVNTVTMAPRQQLTAVPHAAVATTLANGLVTHSAGHREWSDGAYATSCEAYLRPPGSHAYAGATGDGAYRIDPDGGGPNTAFDVWCDMSTEGGGWTLLLRTNGDSTLGYTSVAWTTDNLISPTLVSTAVGNAKYRSFNEQTISTLRGCFVPDDFCYSMAVGGRTALSIFSGQSHMESAQYRPNPNWRLQPYCRTFGINTSYPGRIVRFGFIANQENNCDSNDTGIGFGTGNVNGASTESHGAAEMCLSGGCEVFDGGGSDATVNRAVHGLLWGR